MAVAQARFWVRNVALLLGAAALVAAILVMRPWSNSAHAGDGEGPHGDDSEQIGGNSIPVQVIQPRLDARFRVSVTQPAYVEAYYQDELKARVAGPVLRVYKTIGNRVKAGEKLIEISVPDLVQEVAQKQAIVQQRKREREVAKAHRAKADADILIAKAAIKEKLADVDVADATTTFRQQELERFRGMARDEAITGLVIDERKKFAEAGAAASRAARAMVERARAEETGAKAKLQEAIADEQLKEALIEVAQQDLALAKEKLGFGTLTAPFDGVITRRNVDPGSFVQNSAGSPGRGLLTIQQTEVVTIVMNLPDNYAPYVDDQTEAIIQMTELPEVEIRARVTRHSPSLQTPAQDRTMRVEVDLYNRGPKAWEAFKQRVQASNGAVLKDGKLPVFPTANKDLRDQLGVTRLLPGMYGTMQLVLHNFRNVHLIPSQAIFTKGGKSYIYIVRQGTAHLTAVDVQVDDGILAKVTMTAGPRGQRRELTGAEQIILNNQGELTDGQAVEANQVKW
jgi:membrane fusion protein (multidrug efflux system)